MPRWKPGESGNSKGKPKGALRHTTRQIQELLDDSAEVLTEKAINLAKEGNLLALRLCLERLLPPRKDRPITLKLPKINGATAIPEALTAILEAVAKGQLTPGESEGLVTILKAYGQAVELTDLAKRIEALENL